MFGFGGPKGMMSGLEIADAVRRQREYQDLVNERKMSASHEEDEHLNWAKTVRLWWLERQPRIWIDDFSDKPSDQKGRLNPNSYNLRLHPEMKVYRMLDGIDPKYRGSESVPFLDMKRDNPVDRVTIPESGYIMRPGTLYIARTVEHTQAFNCVPCLNGRSSIGRLGIMVHITAGFGDVGFCGTWTLEIVVVHPVKVYPNVEICQIAYDTISRRHRPYQSRKYAGQYEATASRLYMEFQNANSDRRDQKSVSV